MNTIIIIGGGASGLMAGIMARANSDNRVIILEKNNKLGKKILVSGNGRCNMTNINASSAIYNYPLFVEKVFNQFGVKETLDFFHSKGLMIANDNEGRAYPYSYNANTVLAILVDECKRLGIEVKTDSEVLSVIKVGDKFKVESKSGRQYVADKLICSTGGRVGYNNTEDNYHIINKFKHHIINLYPALVPLKTPKKQVAGLSGIRVKAKVTLKQGNNIRYQEVGEVLFKEEGLSGIAVFNASLYYERVRTYKDYMISLDLLPDMKLNDIIDRYNKLSLPIESFLNGIFNNKISDKILRDSKSNNITIIAQFIKDMKFDIIDDYGFKYAQITVGGIDINEVNPITLESYIIPNLYFSGEILDVDAPCGGYNLQWAWSSGAVAGRNASKLLILS